MRHKLLVLLALLGLVTAIYAAGHFAIDADVNKLISKDLPWRQREAAFNKFFPSQEETMLAVVDAPTSELATQATAALIQKLSNQKNHFHSIVEAVEGQFFRRTGFCSFPPRRWSASPRNWAKPNRSFRSSRRIRICAD